MGRKGSTPVKGDEDAEPTREGISKCTLSTAMLAGRLLNIGSLVLNYGFSSRWRDTKVSA